METLLNTSSSPETPTSNVRHPQTTSESSESRTARLGTPEPDQLACACPRCESTNTKFCYYNNYNRSQPRHFCKSCRRYWTRGGSLRNVPVGGGTRKSASSHKRSRTISTAAVHITTTSSLVTNVMTQAHNPVEANPVSVGTSSGWGSGSLMNLNDSVLPETESLSSWFRGQMGMDCGILPLNVNGPGPNLSYGLGVLDWPMEPVGGENGGAAVIDGSPGCDTWQMNEAAEGDCFAWPDLAISTSTIGKGLN